MKQQLTANIWICAGIAWLVIAAAVAAIVNKIHFSRRRDE